MVNEMVKMVNLLIKLVLRQGGTSPFLLQPLHTCL